MPPRNLKSEAGYSLVEVLAAIVILTIAIIPMVTMFDVGLRSATTSGNYDKARALANSNLETVKAQGVSSIIGSDCPVPPGSSFGCQVGTSPGSGELFGLTEITVTVDWGATNSYEVKGVTSGASP